MNATKLVHALRRMDTEIDRATTTPAQREALRRDLLDVTVLRRPPGRRLKKLSPRWPTDFDLLDRVGYISVAIVAHIEHGLSIAAAAEIARLRESDVLYAFDLLGRCGRSVEWAATNADDGVRAAVDAALQRLVVHVAPYALAEMVSAALEGAAPRRDGGVTEVYGTAFGTTTIGARDAKHERRHTVHINRVATQLRAKATDDAVWPSRTSHAIHERVARDVVDDGSVLVGNYHSHPWSSWSELRASRGWQFSEDDADFARTWQAQREAAGRCGYFNIIVATAPTRGSTSGPKIRKLARNRIQLRVGRTHRVVLSVFRCQLDGDLDSVVELQSQGISIG